VLLNQLPELSGDEIQLLLDQGYLQADQALTAKAVSFKQQFLEEKAELVYQAILDSADDVEAFINLRAKGVIKQHKTFLIIVRHLIAQGRILRKN
jgi:hypothetical protein